MIDIKDISGNIRFSTPINEGSKRKFLLMKEDCITLKFSLESPIYFKLGDCVDIPNDFTSLFEVCDIQKPTFNNSTGGYDYDLRLDAYYWKWKNKKFKYTPETGGQESSWSLTASLDVQLGVFLKNLQALGYTYRGKNFEFSIDSTVENKAIAMSYDNMNLLDALSAMAQSWECEYWITNSVIHFGRCEYGTPVDFELGKNVETMTRSDSQTNFATRIYAFGSTRNIPTNYRPVDESVVVNGVTQKRLMLPVDIPYIDAYPNMSTEEAVEDIVVFDDVYPRRIGSVSDITTHEYKDVIQEEGKPDAVKKWNAYRFKDSGITFSKDYVLEGQELKIIFQSGALNGMEFAVTFNPCDKEGGEVPIPEKNADGSWNPAAQVWEIVRNEDYGRPLPDDVLRPQGEHMEGNVLVPADTYILSGFDTKFVSDAMIPAAEEELKEKALKYIEKSKIDPSTYDNKMMFDCMVDDNGNLKMFEVGDRVNLINSAYFETGSRQSRIIGFEYNLDIPYDSPIYTVGETASYSRIGEIESKLENISFQGQTYISGGNGVYLIRTNDSTPATNNNAYSARRALQQFLSKDREDTAQELIKFIKGLLIGENGSGFKSLQDGTSQLVVDRLYVKIKAIFDELEVKKKTHVGGEQILSPASMKCIKVEETTNAYRCYFKAEEDGIEIKNQFTVGTLAMSQEYNVKTGVSHHVGNRYYWRAVTAVGVDYIDLSKTECDAESDIPAPEDDIIGFGHKTDITRQGAIVMSSVNEVSPSIIMYQGINSFSLVGKDIIGFDFDKATGKAHMRVYGDTYIGFRDRSSYFEYTQENGVRIKGRLTTESGKDVESTLNNFQDQIDGVRETFYGEYSPTLSNYPASEWTSEALKKRHEMDVFTNIQAYIDDEKTPDSGKSWRWIRTGNVWGWTQIADSDMSKAYKEAALAKQAAEDAQYSVNNANKEINGLKNFTDKAFSDGVISRSEASAIEKYIKNIQSIEKSVAESYVKVYNNPLLAGNAKINLASAYKGFNTSTTELLSSIESAITDGVTTVLEKAEVDGRYDTFNLKYGDFTAYLNAANNYIQDFINTKADNANEEIAGYSYIKKAFSENTLIEGGLIQNSINILGYTHPIEGFKVMSGTNGIYDATKIGGGLSAWYGGDMIDAFDYYVNGKFVNLPLDAAKGVDRMDGTGYRANGNLWWDVNGKVHADPLSFFVGEATVGNALALFKYVGTDINSDENIDFDEVEYVIPQRPFQKLDIANDLRIGDAVLKWDGKSNALYIEKSDGSPIGFYTFGFMSAKGLNPGISGGDGATTLGSLNNVGSWADTIPTADRIMVQLSGATHWTSKPLSEIVGLDTTALADYLTKNNYATQPWVNTQLGGYATTASLKTVSDKLDNFLTGTDTDNIINK